MIVRNYLRGMNIDLFNDGFDTVNWLRETGQTKEADELHRLCTLQRKLQGNHQREKVTP